MLIYCPGIKEGLLYQRTTVWLPSRTLFMRKEAYRLLEDIERCPLGRWVDLQDWSWVTSPEQKAMAIQSEINWRECMPGELESHRCQYFWTVAYKDPEETEDWRYDRMYPYIRTENLDTAIDKASAVFARGAIIRTLEKPGFGQQWSDRLREYPVPEGVLQYFRKELRKRRQKLIEEID